LQKISFDLGSVSLNSIKRAAYKYTDRCSVDLRIVDNEGLCIFNFKEQISDQEFEKFMIEFRNEVLDEELRAEIFSKTEPIRNLILAHAFSNANLEEND